MNRQRNHTSTTPNVCFFLQSPRRLLCAPAVLLKRPAHWIAIVFAVLLWWNTAQAQVNAKLLLTSNLQGKATLTVANQQTEDPLLLLAQSIMAERAKGIDLYLDLGNGFYPGAISKFSSGSIMMDFFDFFDCAGTLVSSKDLQIGLENLEFLQKSRQVQLVSANILRKGQPVFAPYFISNVAGVPVAFIGFSSKRVEFDIAEKELYGLSLEEEKAALEPILANLKASGITHIVLLSGLRLSRTMALINSYPEINMAICGGDYAGELFEGEISRIDSRDGRSVIMLDADVDYYLVEISLNDGIRLRAMQPMKAIARRTAAPSYAEFANRLTLWKEKYIADQSQTIAQLKAKEYRLDDHRLCQLLRDRFNSDIAVVEPKTINSFPISKDVSQSDILQMVNIDYNIFIFDLTGDQIAKVLAQNEYKLDITGVTQKGKKITVQGYLVEKQRQYRVAATQSAFRNIQQVLGEKIKYNNSWKTITDVLIEDLANNQVILRDDFAYLERRYRTTLDLYLANFVSSASVNRGPTIDTPVSQPDESYSKWGLEDQIDLALYNRYHRFVFTPYVLYARQDEVYVQNLLRGTLLYEYNLRESLKPYNKVQCDTVVEDVNGLRPILVRETAGGALYGDYLNGKIGLGFEKKVQDPSEDFLYGFETILTFKYPFWKYFTYKFNIDNFISTRDPNSGRWGIRSDIENGISAVLNSYLNLSLRYKYFYLYENNLNEDYRSSQIFTTLDVKTDWKFY